MYCSTLDAAAAWLYCPWRVIMIAISCPCDWILPWSPYQSFRDQPRIGWPGQQGKDTRGTSDTILKPDSTKFDLKYSILAHCYDIEI